MRAELSRSSSGNEFQAWNLRYISPDLIDLTPRRPERLLLRILIERNEDIIHMLEVSNLGRGK